MSQGYLPGRCPKCQAKLDSATAVSQLEEALPKPGDVAVCSECLCLMAFTEGLYLREITIEEHSGMAPELQHELRKAVWITERVREKLKGQN